MSVIITYPAPPVSGSLTLVRGDDYLALDARELTFSSSDWPDLTGATVRMTMRRRAEAFGSGSDPILLSVTDVPASRIAGSGAQTVVFELINTDTTVLIPGTAAGKWDVQATLAGGSIVTLAVDTVDVTEDQTRD